MTDPQIKQALADLGLRLPDNIPPGAIIDIAIAYVRVSSSGQLGRGGDKDGDGYSIPAQVQLSEKEAGNLKRMSGLSWNFGGGPHGLMVKR